MPHPSDPDATSEDVGRSRSTLVRGGGLGTVLVCLCGTLLLGLLMLAPAALAQDCPQTTLSDIEDEVM